jgi:hypothetical protein
MVAGVKKQSRPGRSIVLPGHHPPFVGLSRRVDEVVRHHEARLRDIVDACARDPRSAADLVKVLPPPAASSANNPRMDRSRPVAGGGPRHRGRRAADRVGSDWITSLWPSAPTFGGPHRLATSMKRSSAFFPSGLLMGSVPLHHHDPAIRLAAAGGGGLLALELKPRLNQPGHHSNARYAREGQSFLRIRPKILQRSLHSRSGWTEKACCGASTARRAGRGCWRPDRARARHVEPLLLRGPARRTAVVVKSRAAGAGAQRGPAPSLL